MSGTTQEDGYQGQMDVTTQESLYNSLSFLANQTANQNWTVTIVQVKKVTDGGLDKPAKVDVQPMVNQQDGQGQAVPHGTIHSLPVWRLQGGTLGAIIADPKVDDIGIMLVAMRDISTVVKTGKIASPGSKRTFDPADGIYLGSLLTKKPDQYIRFTDEGLEIVDKTGNKFEFTAAGMKLTPGGANPVTVAGNLVVTGNLQLGGQLLAEAGGTYAGNFHIAGTMTADTDVVAGGKSLKVHTHGGVTTGGGTTGPNN